MTTGLYIDTQVHIDFLKKHRDEFSKRLNSYLLKEESNLKKLLSFEGYDVGTITKIAKNCNNVKLKIPLEIITFQQEPYHKQIFFNGKLAFEMFLVDNWHIETKWSEYYGL